MFKYAIEVEDNVMTSRKIRQKVEIDRRKVREENQASTSPSTDAKFDVMMRKMERLMNILDLDNRPHNRDKSDPYIRNPNFRRPAPPQIRQRDQRNIRNVEDHKVRPPFLDNYVDEEEEFYPLDNEIHHFDIIDSEIYLTKEEHC